MRHEEVRALVREFGRRRTVFHTYHDHYAFERLSWEIGAGAAVRELRNGPCGRLLAKPTVRQRLAELGAPHLDAARWLAFWPQEYRTYVLTLGTWPDSRDGSRGNRFHQMARRESNLVVHLNFDHGHDRGFDAQARETRGDFNWLAKYGHFKVKGRNVLSWARVDIELGRKEALIEEIQSDWIREARSMLPERWIRGTAEKRKRILNARRQYYDTVLGPHLRQWSESTLLATLGLLRNDLGIERVWYYGFDVGCALKDMTGWLPPRSYYTELPKRFCFRECDEGPAWIEDLRRVRRLRRKTTQPWRWWLMD